LECPLWVKSRPVIVIDEFERITNDSERMLFADFIKQVGDQSVPITTFPAPHPSTARGNYSSTKLAQKHSPSKFGKA
jgi:hypothetical protein